MSIDDKIEEMITESINILDRELKIISEKQGVQPLDRGDIARIVEFLKTMVLVQKDKRLEIKEKVVETKSMTDDELNAAILAEAEKIKKTL